MANAEERVELKGTDERAATEENETSFIDIAPDIVSTIDSLPVEAGPKYTWRRDMITN